MTTNPFKMDSSSTTVQEQILVSASSSDNTDSQSSQSSEDDFMVNSVHSDILRHLRQLHQDLIPLTPVDMDIVKQIIEKCPPELMDALLRTGDCELPLAEAYVTMPLFIRKYTVDHQRNFNKDYLGIGPDIFAKISDLCFLKLEM